MTQEAFLGTDLSPEAEKAVALAEKLLRTAGRGTEESAVYVARAMEILAAHNLDMAAVEEFGEGGQRFARMIRDGQRPIVFHVGDLDPSGWHMTEDNRDRINLFTGHPVMLQRLALNMDQVEQHKPPPNYVKDKDSRKDQYVERFGTDECFEVDALDPSVLQGLIRDAVLKIRDEAKWNEALEQEVSDIRFIDDLITQAEVPSEDED